MIYDGEEKTYVGCTLADREENYSDDSDFYAVVYDQHEHKMKRIDYGSTSYYSTGYASVDATEDIRQLAKEDAYKRLVNYMKFDSRPKVGRRIRTIKGRKVPIGKEGVIIHIYENKIYGHTQYTKLTCKGDSGEEFITYPQNVEVIPEPDNIIEELARNKAEYIYNNNLWHLFFSNLAIVI